MEYDPQEIFDRFAASQQMMDESGHDGDLGLLALVLAALDQPGISLGRYVHHLRTLSEDVRDEHMRLMKAGEADTVETRLQTLKSVISDQHAYVGDTAQSDSIDNTSLIRVIDRSKGNAVSLGILYISAARAQGWSIEGIDVPGHLVCRLEHEGRRIIFDPFFDCKILEAPDLRLLVKQNLGETMELSSKFFEPADTPRILISLQNGLKHRYISDGHYEAALNVVQRMQKINPREYRLLLDAGVLYARVEQTKAAIDALEAYIEAVPKKNTWQSETYDAQLLLEELRGRLN